MHLKVTPKAAKTEFVKYEGGRLFIRLQAQPIDGKANKALIDFLSKQFKVAKSRLILKGDTSRLKTVFVPNPKKLPNFILEHIHA